MKTKTCNKCGEIKLITEFVKHKGSPDGIGYHCKLCNKDQVRNWRKKNPERSKFLTYIGNRRKYWSDEERKEYYRLYYLKHREETLKYKKEWYKKNKEKDRKEIYNNEVSKKLIENEIKIKPKGSSYKKKEEKDS